MNTVAAPKRSKPCGYEDDYYAWLMTTAEQLRQRRFGDIDIEHIVEELEDTGKREHRALESHIKQVTLHLLKWQYQPTLRCASWSQTIRNGRNEIEKLLRDSPSLTRLLAMMLSNEYPAAKADAVDKTGLGEETFPAVCPFTVEQVVDKGFWPE
jgi:hypothetical protein